MKKEAKNKKKSESDIPVDPDNKRIGGLDRAKIAREEMKIIFSDPKNPLYFAKDIEYAKKFGVTRHTIYKARDTLCIPSRSKRILLVLNNTSTKDLTIRELSKKLNVKYQNLYKIIKDNGVPVKTE
jgi:hypothetical protein